VRAATESDRTYEVGVEQVVLRDDSRARSIPLKVFHPLGRGPFPVIVFSHGLGGSKESYDYLGRQWAAHGFVDVHPTHAGTDGGSFWKIVFGLVFARIGPNEVERLLADRAADLSFVISSLASIERNVPAVAGSIDARRVGVAGHSAGAATALLLGGASLESNAGARRSLFDARVSALCVLSPPGSGLLGFDARSWNDIKVPTFTVRGSEDDGTIGQRPIWRQEAFDGMPPENKYHAVVNGANHYTFADPGAFGMLGRLTARGATGDPLRMRACVARLTTAYWNAYLHGDRSERERLERRAGAAPFGDLATILAR